MAFRLTFEDEAPREPWEEEIETLSDYIKDKLEVFGTKLSSGDGKTATFSFDDYYVVIRSQQGEEPRVEIETWETIQTREDGSTVYMARSLSIFDEGYFSETSGEIQEYDTEDNLVEWPEETDQQTAEQNNDFENALTNGGYLDSDQYHWFSTLLKSLNGCSQVDDYDETLSETID